MKKLSVLFTILFIIIFTSCTPTTNSEKINVQETKNTETNNETAKDEQPSIPRTEWDKDNIYLTNTPSVPDSTYKWIYLRKSGTSGIIGKFVQTSNKGYQVFSYTFYDSGYFEYTEEGYVKNSYVKNTKRGTYIITKQDNSCYKFTTFVSLYNGLPSKVGGETCYYKVDANGMILSNIAF